MVKRTRSMFLGFVALKLFLAFVLTDVGRSQSEALRKKFRIIDGHAFPILIYDTGKVPGANNDFQFNYVFKVGGIEDKRAEKDGLSHFLEHILTTASKSHPYESRPFGTLISNGLANASTSMEYTQYYWRGKAEVFEQSFRIYTDLLWNPVFDEKAVEAERSAILNESNEYLTQPQEGIGLVSRELLFGKNHPYTSTIIGFKDEIKKLTRDDLIAHWAKYYNNKYGFLAVSGNFTKYPYLEELVVSLVRNNAHVAKDGLGHSSKVAEDFNADLLPTSDKTAVVTISNEVPNQVSMYWAFPKLNPKQLRAMELVIEIFGNGLENSVTRKLMAENLIAGSSANFYHYGNYGHLLMAIFPTSEGMKNLQKIMDAYQFFLDGMRKGAIDPALISYIKRNLKNSAIPVLSEVSAINRPMIKYGLKFLKDPRYGVEEIESDFNKVIEDPLFDVGLSDVVDVLSLEFRDQGMNYRTILTQYDANIHKTKNDSFEQSKIVDIYTSVDDSLEYRIPQKSPIEFSLKASGISEYPISTKLPEPIVKSTKGRSEEFISTSDQSVLIEHPVRESNVVASYVSLHGKKLTKEELFALLVGFYGAASQDSSDDMKSLKSYGQIISFDYGAYLDRRSFISLMVEGSEDAAFEIPPMLFHRILRYRINENILQQGLKLWREHQVNTLQEMAGVIAGSELKNRLDESQLSSKEIIAIIDSGEITVDFVNQTLSNFFEKFDVVISVAGNFERSRAELLRKKMESMGQKPLDTPVISLFKNYRSEMIGHHPKILVADHSWVDIPKVDLDGTPFGIARAVDLGFSLDFFKSEAFHVAGTILGKEIFTENREKRGLGYIHRGYTLENERGSVFFVFNGQGNQFEDLIHVIKGWEHATQNLLSAEERLLESFEKIRHTRIGHLDDIVPMRQKARDNFYSVLKDNLPNSVVRSMRKDALTQMNYTNHILPVIQRITDNENKLIKQVVVKNQINEIPSNLIMDDRCNFAFKEEPVGKGSFSYLFKSLISRFRPHNNRSP